MDLVEACHSLIDEELKSLDDNFDCSLGLAVSADNYLPTQQVIDSIVVDKDKNLDRIIDQQAYIKIIIERDGRIKAARQSIAENSRAIESLRKACSQVALNGLKRRQELLDEQSRELEKFQILQLKSIADDYERHQKILETRRREVATLKKETENEETNRAAYLADVEKNLEKHLRDRQHMSQGNFVDMLPNDRSVDADTIALATIDEYAPYGSTSASRANNNPKRGSGRGRGRVGRGRRGA